MHFPNFLKIIPPMIMKNLAISIKNVSLCGGLAFVGINTLAVTSAAAIGLVNPNFEQNNVQSLTPLTPAPGKTAADYKSSPSPGFVITDQGNVAGWKTTATDGGIELWESGFLGVSTASGNGVQFAEVNATGQFALFQDLLVTASGGATELAFDFWHRAREQSGTQVNAIIVKIIDDAGAGTVLFNKVFATQLNPTDINATNKGWANYTSTNVLAGLSLGPILAPARGTDRSVRFQFEATSLSSGTADVYTTTTTAGNSTTYNVSGLSTTNTSDLSFGNFLDNANLQTIPFDFSPNLGIGVLGALYLGNRFLNSLKNRKDTKS